MLGMLLTICAAFLSVPVINTMTNSWCRMGRAQIRYVYSSVDSSVGAERDVVKFPYF